VDIFNFAPNRVSRAEYYNWGVTGEGLSAADTGPNAGPVNGGRRVPFTNPLIRAFSEELAYNELAHVRLYRRTLGPARSAAGYRFHRRIRGCGRAAGVPNFDPFADEVSFFLGGMLFEGRCDRGIIRST
jgi:hypothetical protein